MKNDLDKYFKTARESEPVVTIDEARSILESGRAPHANKPATKPFFQTFKFKTIMYSSIIMAGLAFFLLMHPSEKNLQQGKITAQKPNGQYPAISAGEPNQASQPGKTPDIRLAANKGPKDSIRYLTKDTFTYLNSNFPYDKLFDTNLVFKKVFILSGLKMDSVQMVHLETNDLSKVDSMVKSVSRELKLHSVPELMDLREAHKGKKYDSTITINTSYFINKDSSQKGVYNTYFNLKRRDIDHNGNEVNHDKIVMRDGVISIIRPKQITFSDGTRKDTFEVIKVLTGKGLNSDSVTRININHFGKPSADGHFSETYQQEKENGKDIRIITLNASSSTSGLSLHEKPLIQGVKFIELDDAILNKLGIIKGEYTVYYYGEAASPSKRSSEISIGNNVVPAKGVKIPGREELKSRLNTLTRDFFPVFVSDMTGTKMLSFNLLRPDFVDKDYLIKHSNTMVPIMVKTAPKTQDYHWENVVFWFEPTDNFFEQLPSEIGNELRKEYRHLNGNDANEKSSCTYFEACRANNGAINSVLTYPNPASVDLNVSVNLLDTRNIKIELLDISGRPVKELLPQKFMESGKHDYSFSIDDIGSGVYLLLVESAQGEQSVQRVVVHK